MFQSDKKEEDLFAALRHLKYNKHEVVLFHTYDAELELNFNFDNSPKKLVAPKPPTNSYLKRFHLLPCPRDRSGIAIIITNSKDFILIVN